MSKHATGKLHGFSERGMYVGISVALLGYVLGTLAGHQFDQPGDWANAVRGLQVVMVPSLLLGYYIMYRN